MNMKSHSRGMRAFAAAFALLGGLMVSIPSQALTVTLSGVSGNNCTYTSITVDVLGNTTVNCSGATAPGTISFQSSSIAADASVATNVALTRTGGTTGAVGATVGVSGAGTCTVNGGASAPVNFAAGDATNQTVSVLGTVAGGSCSLSLTAATGGASLGAAATFSINNPASPGTLSFNASSYAAVVNGNVAVTINRTGGNLGAVGANITTSPSGACTVNQPTISFAAGNTTPVTVTVTGGGAPATCTLTLSGATGGVTLGGTATVDVAAASSSGNALCQALNLPPPPANLLPVSIGLVWHDISLGSQSATTGAQTGSSALPTYAAPYTTGMLIVTQLSTSPVEPLTIKMSISPCQGDMTGGGQNACVKSDTNRAGTDFKWTKGDARYFVNQTISNAYGYCWVPGASSQYYLNIQYTYPGCPYGSPCGFSMQTTVADGRMIE